MKGGTRRQIDYASIDVRGAMLVEDVEACDDIALGMDHRAVKVTLLLLLSSAEKAKTG